MSDENLEAPNPFNQTSYQEPSQASDSLKFEGGFWNENDAQNKFSTGSAYDDNSEYTKIDSPNAYDDTGKPKSNPISSLFNNMKAKLDKNTTHESAYDDNPHNNAYSEPFEAEPNKASHSNSKSSNLLSTNQISMTNEQLDKKEAYLEKREKQLLEQKKRLELMKHELSSNQLRRDNWPCSYYPITFHSIQQEIPPHARSHMKRMYTLVLLTFWCFFLNTFAEFFLYFVDVTTDKDILLAVLYFFIGITGAWRLWYRQIYYAIRDRKTLKWWCFFLFFAAHCGFCCVMAIGVEKWGGAGVITMINAFSARKSFSGFVCLIAVFFWGLLCLGSLYYMKRSWALFKQRGGLDDSKGEITSIVARHAAEQLV